MASDSNSKNKADSLNLFQPPAENRKPSASFPTHSKHFDFIRYFALPTYENHTHLPHTFGL